MPDYAPDLATDAQDNLYLAWYVDGDYDALYMRLDRLGNPLVRALAEEARGESPAVAGSGGEGFVLSYSEGCGEGWLAVRRIGLGGEVGERLCLGSYWGGRPWADLAVDGQGRVQVSFIQNHPYSEYSLLPVVKHRLYDRNLQPLAGPWLLENASGYWGPHQVLGLRVAGGASPRVFWRELVADGQERLFYSNLPFGGGERIFQKDLGDSLAELHLVRYPPVAALDSQGNAHLVWVYDTAPAWQLGYRKVDPAGNVLLSHTLPITPPSYYNGWPRLLTDSSNRLHLFYASQWPFGVYHIILNAEGQIIQQPTLVPGTENATSLAAAIDGADGFHLVFSKEAPPQAGQGVPNGELFYVDTVNDPAASDPTRPDPSVASGYFTHTPAVVREGQSVTLTGRVYNGGWVSATSVLVRLTYPDGAGHDHTLTNLAPGSFADLSDTWTVPHGLGQASPVVTITVDPENALAESSEANNTTTRALAVELPPMGGSFWINVFDETLDEDHDDYFPVPGATLTLEGAPSVVTQTRPTGGAFFRDVPFGTYTLRVVAPGYAPVAPQQVEVGHDGDGYTVIITPNPPIKVWVNTWGTISGTVQSDGQPLSGVIVSLDDGLRTASSDDQGRFTVTRASAGEHTLTLMKGNFGREVRVLSVATGAMTTVEVAMTPTTTGYLRGTVTAPDGAPVSGAGVTLKLASGSTVASTSTSFQGRYTFDVPNTSGQYYYLVVQKSGYRSYDGSSRLFAVPAGLDTVQDVGLTWEETAGGRSVGYKVTTRAVEAQVPYGGEAYVYWGNFNVWLSMRYASTVGGTTVNRLRVEVDNRLFEWHLLVVQWDLGSPVLALLDQGVPIPIPGTTGDQTHVYLDSIELVRRTNPSQTYGQRIPLNIYTLGQPIWLSDISVPVDWNDLEVRLHVLVGRACAEENQFCSSSALMFDRLVLLWNPRANTITGEVDYFY